MVHCMVCALYLSKAVLKEDRLTCYHAKSLKWITDTLQLQVVVFLKESGKGEILPSDRTLSRTYLVISLEGKEKWLKLRVYTDS